MEAGKANAAGAMALPLRTLAPAKINLGLFVGPARADGRHELVSVMQPISLADEITLEAADGADEVVCPGVDGENLAARAIELFRRATGWEQGAVRLRIDKRIPVAAGMGGGSADAGAALRLLHAASDLGDVDLLLALAAQLGADVPAQVAPARMLATGAGELLEPLPDPITPVGVLVLAQARGLVTAEVYAAADRLQRPREPRELNDIRGRLRSALAPGAPGALTPLGAAARTRASPALGAAARIGAPLAPGAALPADALLLANDLQRPAQSLYPDIAAALEQAARAGAEHAFVSGSGPTVLGLFAGADGPGRAGRAAAALAGRLPAAVAAATVDADFAAVQPLCT
jgi:4-diphosphocytidyl-2-C-methyl-D-erythritol kinase